MHNLCANFLTLCQLMIFEFSYTTNDEFIDGIRNCTLQGNSLVDPPNRIPVNLSIAQAVLESAYGTSRFAVEGKNYYGIRETDPTEPHIKSLDPSAQNKMLRRYEKGCDSTFDYIELLNTDDRYEEFQQLLTKQFIINDYNLYALASALAEPYAKDESYAEKLHRILEKLDE